MKTARGNVRKLLILVGRIQHRVGQAKGLFDNDRNLNGFEEGQRLLQEAFNLCLTATGDYAQVEDREDGGSLPPEKGTE